jgi:hypothetical protein
VHKGTVPPIGKGIPRLRCHTNLQLQSQRKSAIRQTYSI